MGGERGEQIAFGEVAHVDEDAAELVATFALEFKGAVEVFSGNDAALDQELAQPLVGGGMVRLQVVRLGRHYSSRSSIKAARSAGDALRATASRSFCRFAVMVRRRGRWLWSSKLKLKK